MSEYIYETVGRTMTDLFLRLDKYRGKRPPSEIQEELQDEGYVDLSYDWADWWEEQHSEEWS